MLLDLRSLLESQTFAYVGAGGIVFDGAAATSPSRQYRYAPLQLIFQSIDSDLTVAGAGFSKIASEVLGPSNTNYSVSLTPNQTKTSYGFTPANYPGLVDWPTGLSVHVKVGARANRANVRLSIALDRVSATGVVVDAGTVLLLTSNISSPTNFVLYEGDTPAKTYASGAATDRVRIRIIHQDTSGFGASVNGSWNVIPFTLGPAANGVGVTLQQFEIAVRLSGHALEARTFAYIASTGADLTYGGAAAEARTFAYTAQPNAGPGRSSILFNKDKVTGTPVQGIYARTFAYLATFAGEPDLTFGFSFVTEDNRIAAPTSFESPIHPYIGTGGITFMFSPFSETGAIEGIYAFEHHSDGRPAEPLETPAWDPPRYVIPAGRRTYRGTWLVAGAGGQLPHLAGRAAATFVPAVRPGAKKPLFSVYLAPRAAGGQLPHLDGAAVLAFVVRPPTAGSGAQWTGAAAIATIDGLDAVRLADDEALVLDLARAS